MSDIDAVLRELAEISDRLAELPATEREQRSALHRRREELRAEARSTHEESPAEMREELRLLEQRWEAIHKDHIDLVKQAGDVASGGAFGFTADAMKINRAIDENAGLGGIESRIKYLKSRLSELDG